MIALYRIIKFAIQNFWRNIWLSVITITILVLTLLIVNMLLTLSVLGQTAVRAVQAKIDVSVSFVPGTSEEMMVNARGYLQSLPQVKDARYLNPDEVLAEFKSKNANKPDVLASLEEVGGNPFGGQIIITAHDPNDFPFILEALDNPQFKPVIEDKDFQSHEDIIGAINQTIDSLRLGGIIIGLFFLLITVVIVVNTIRVAIYTHREEIGIMRLVGASDALVRGPFLVEAVGYTLVAIGISVVVLYFFLLVGEPPLDRFFGNTPTGLTAYFVRNFWLIFGAEFVVLSVLNMLATVLAMRRYLKV